GARARPPRGPGLAPPLGDQAMKGDNLDRRVEEILQSVREGGDLSLLELRARHDGVGPEEPLLLDRAAPARARDELPPEPRALLERTASRVERFAREQRACLTDLDVAVEGGRAGHTLSPVDSAGCYAPGGRYPLVSSVLMTAVTARAAGVADV